MNEKKDSFIVRGKWVRALSTVTPEERLKVYDDIFNYAFNKVLPEKTYPIFEIIKEDIDSDNDRYDKKCERNKANGYKGGRPKKNEQKETQENPTVIEKPNGYFENPKKPINNNINNNININNKDIDIGILEEKKIEPDGSTPKQETDFEAKILKSNSENDKTHGEEEKSEKTPQKDEKSNIKPVILKTEEEKEKNCSKKEKEFKETLMQFIAKYGEKMIEEFYNYWREWNKSKTQMRWQLEKTWDVNLRLIRWAKNDYNKFYKKTGADTKNVNEIWAK